MKVTFRIVICCTLLATPAVASAESYYVSMTGDDSGPGTMAEPWRTLGPIAGISPGDTVNIGDGTWTEALVVPAGTVSERVVVQAWPGQTPVIDTTGMEGHSVRLGAYTDFIGLTVRNTRHMADFDYLVIADGDGIVVRGCSLQGRDPNVLLPGTSRLREGFRQGGLKIQGDDVVVEDSDIVDIYINAIGFSRSARRSRVLRNRIVNFGWNALDVPFSDGEIRGLLVEGNHIEGSLGSDGVQMNPSFVGGSTEPDVTNNRGVVIRGNFFRQFGENAIDLKGTSHIVVERNVFSRAEGDNDGLTDGMPHAAWARAASGGAVMHGSRASSGHAIIRHNVFFDNNGGIAMMGRRPEPYGWYAYNNTLAGNVRHAYVSRSTEEGGSAGAGFAGRRPVFVNNIVVGQNRSCLRMRGSRDGYINHNMYFDAPWVGWVQDGGGRVGGYDLDGWRVLLGERGFGGRDMRSIWADPEFVDADLRPIGLPREHDFNLAPGSPAIDAGQPLTRTVSSGSGRALPVEDAGYFYDGFGVTEGDQVQVGASTFARVVSVDADRQVLSLDRDITWSEGDPVTLPYEGAAPDIGACEVGRDTCWYSAGASNEPPRVDAGPDAAGRTGSWIALSGTAEDDGNPMPLVVSWRLDGAGAADFEDNSAAMTRVRFSEAGVYTLVLSATDGERTTEDSLTVAVAAGSVGCAGGRVVLDEDFSGPSGLDRFEVVLGGAWQVADGGVELREPERGAVNGNLIVHELEVSGDFEMEVDGILQSPVSDFGDFSVVFLYQDVDNNEFVSLNQRDVTSATDTDTTHGIISVGGGTASQRFDFASSGLISEDVTYRVRVVRRGDTVEVFRDDVFLGAAIVPRGARGRLGLGTRNDGVRFERMTVTVDCVGGPVLDAGGRVDGGVGAAGDDGGVLADGGGDDPSPGAGCCSIVGRSSSAHPVLLPWVLMCVALARRIGRPL